jgi:hypothetical protein
MSQLSFVRQLYAIIIRKSALHDHPPNFPPSFLNTPCVSSLQILSFLHVSIIIRTSVLRNHLSNFRPSFSSHHAYLLPKFCLMCLS